MERSFQRKNRSGTTAWPMKSFKKHLGQQRRRTATLSATGLLLLCHRPSNYNSVATKKAFMVQIELELVFIAVSAAGRSSKEDGAIAEGRLMGHVLHGKVVQYRWEVGRVQELLDSVSILS